MPPDDFCNDLDAGARPTTLRPRAYGEPCARVTGPYGRSQPHGSSSGVGELEARTTLSKTSVLVPEDFPRPGLAREHPVSFSCISLSTEEVEADGSTEVALPFRAPH